MSFSDYTDLDRQGDNLAEHRLSEYHATYLSDVAQRYSLPTLQDVVQGYLAVGISKRRAARYIFDDRMRSHVARGKGSKAARRAQALFDRIGRDIEALNARIARNRRQWAADEAAERRSESRPYGRTADVVNPHDD